MKDLKANNIDLIIDTLNDSDLTMKILSDIIKNDTKVFLIHYAKIKNLSILDTMSLQLGIFGTVEDFLIKGKKIAAVKECRNITGYGLKRSKEMVEEFAMYMCYLNADGMPFDKEQYCPGCEKLKCYCKCMNCLDYDYVGDE